LALARSADSGPTPAWALRHGNGCARCTPGPRPSRRVSRVVGLAKRRARCRPRRAGRLLPRLVAARGQVGRVSSSPGVRGRGRRSDSMWNWSWLPWSYDVSGAALVIEARRDVPVSPVYVHLRDDPADVPESAPSMGTLVAWWIEWFDTGACACQREPKSAPFSGLQHSRWPPADCSFSREGDSADTSERPLPGELRRTQAD
jgi:hypothetical protein